MKLIDRTPEVAFSGTYRRLAQSPSRTWGVAVAAEQPTLMVLYKAPHWETPGVLASWRCNGAKRALAGYEALVRLFRDLNEHTPLEALVRRLPRAERPFPRKAS